jgi:hypothetical protein
MKNDSFGVPCDFEKKIKKMWWKIRLLFWISEFSVTKELQLLKGDVETSTTLLLRRKDFVGIKFIDFRNAVFCWIRNIPPEIASAMSR